MTEFQAGDRITSPKSGHTATIIKMTDPSSGILRFDQDVEFNRHHGLPKSKVDLEFFDLDTWKPEEQQ